MKRIFSLLLSLFLLFSFTSCAAERQQIFKKDFLDLFDTASFISASDSSQDAFNAHYTAVYNELKAYSQLYDIYMSYGSLVNLKYVNENAAEAPVKVDERIMGLLLFGKEAFEKSNGKVNIAMGAVLSVWHSERENGISNPESAKLPDMGLLKEKAKHTDINNLVLDTENSTVFFADSEMSLDVGAIAKGYVCEKISAFISENNIWDSALISLGGNIKSIGFKNSHEGTPFSVGIENPSGGDYLEVLAVSNGKSVVTSGDYQRYYTVNGVDYCHIINPETLMPADELTSVSVICNDSAYADMLSTALFNMNVEEGMAFVEKAENTEALWIDKNGERHYSSGFKEFVK